MRSESTNRARDPGNGWAAPAAPWSDDDIASLLSQAGEDPSPQAIRRGEPLQPKRESLGGLFSDEPPRQFAALKELATRPALQAAQYDRIQTIRDTTRHLLIAELAENILRQRGGPSASIFSKEAYGEVAALLQQEEALQQEKRRNGRKEPMPIEMSPSAAARWLLSAGLAGLLLGGVATWGLMPRPKPVHDESLQAYLDSRTGKPILPNSDEWREAIRRNDMSRLEPAFYCWNCKKWLPTRNSQKSQSSAALGPAQALAERPLAANRPAAAPGRRKP